MHQTLSRTQLSKNGVIALSMESLDTMQLNVATWRELRSPIQRQFGRAGGDHNSNLLWGEHGHQYEGLGGRL